MEACTLSSGLREEAFINVQGRPAKVILLRRRTNKTNTARRMQNDVKTTHEGKLFFVQQGLLLLLKTKLV